MLVRYSLQAVLVIFALFPLSACTTFEEMRPEICPTCTDAEWQLKVQEREAFIANAKREIGGNSAEFDQYLRDQANEDTNRAGPVLVDTLRSPNVNTNGSVRRWDNKGSPGTWLTAQSPLWACLDRKRWVWKSIKGVRRINDRTSVDEGFCTSDANTQGKTFRIESTIAPYIPPPTDNSIGAAFKSINPLNVLTSCKPMNSAGGMVKMSEAGGPGVSVGILNIGLGICSTLVKMSSKKGKKFIGWTQITLDGELVKVCDKWEDKSMSPTGNAMPCFGEFLGDTKQRNTVFAYTGVRPDNAFGPAGSVSILESCANRNNWASYGRDASSEEVAFCQTRNTVQTNKTYQIEARQLNLNDGNQWIKITVGKSKTGTLDQHTNTRIRQTVKVYKCGNKSFSRMRSKPRDTAAACINDMLGLMGANRAGLDAPTQHMAAQLEALGGYGWTRAEEQKALTGR